MEPKKTPARPADGERAPAPARPKHGSATTSSSPFEEPERERENAPGADAPDDDTVDQPGVLPS